MNFWHYTEINELCLEANPTELRDFIYKAASLVSLSHLIFLTECFILYFYYSAALYIV